MSTMKFQPIIRYAVDFKDRHYKWRLHSKKGFYLLTPGEVIGVLEFCVQQELTNMSQEKLEKLDEKSFLRDMKIGVTKYCLTTDNSMDDSDVTEGFTHDGHLETFIRDYVVRSAELRRLKIK